MRARDFLYENDLDEDWKKWGVPLAYAAANVAAAGANMAGYGGDPDFLKDKTHQVQQQPQGSNSVTVKLDEPRQQDKVQQKQKPEPEQKQGYEEGSKEATTLLALTIWGEARSHGAEGMEAVGHVIMNRVESERNFGDNVKEVVWKRKHFSCWNPTDPNREAMKKIAQLEKGTLDYKRWEQAKQIAAKLMAGQLRDTTHGALFYHTDYIKKPDWAQGQKAVAQIANHVFYKKDRIA